MRQIRENRAHHRRKHQSRRDERHIHHDEVHSLAEFLAGQIAGIGFLQQPHARILAQPEIHLAITGIDGDHARRAALQQAIGEATGGRSDIETNLALERRSSNAPERAPV